jgi:hypothetical protein
MRIAPLAVIATLVCGLAACAGAALADEKKADKTGEHPAAEHPASDAKAEPSLPEDMMKAWMEYATPGPQHKVLDALIGAWDAKSTFWTKPGAEPIVSGGSSEQTWVLGGRFVMQKFQGADASRAYSGMGFTGYNNASKTFESVWMDSESTGMIRTSGTIDETGTVITQTGEYMDPLTHKMHPLKYVTRLVNPTEMIFEMWEPGTGGAEFKTIEVVYSKRP